MSCFRRKGIHDSRFTTRELRHAYAMRLDGMSFRITDVRRYPLFFHEGYTSGAD